MFRFALHPSVEVEPATGTSTQVSQQVQSTYSFPSSSGKPEPGSAVLGGQGRQPEPGSAVLGGQGRPPRSGGAPRIPRPRTPVINPSNIARVAPLAMRALGVANAASTAISLQSLADQTEGFVLDRSPHLPQPVRDWLRWSRSNNPFDPGNFLHYASDRLRDRLYDWLFPNHARSNDALQSPQPLPLSPPFYGGQTSGVSYQVNYTADFKNNSTGGSAGGFPVSSYAIAPGPITGLAWVSSDGGSFYHLTLYHGGGTTQLGTVGPNASANNLSPGPAAITSINRQDGQPDTGGNLAPAPGATRPEGQRAPAIAPAPQIAPQINPQRPIPNNPNPAGQARSIPAPTPAIVPTAAKPSSPLHPKNLSPGKAINPFKSVPDAAPNPVAPTGNAELAPTVTAATAPSSITRPIATPTTAGQMQPGETAQDYIDRLHNEELQRFRNSANLGFTNPFENLTSNILEQNPSTATATPSLNPLIPALGVAGLVGAGAVIARRTIPSGLENTNPTQTGNPSAPVTARPTRTQTQTTPQTPEFPGTGTGTPTNFCSYDSRNISGKVDQTNATLGTIQVFLQEQVLSKVSSIDNKMGNTALTGGVTGALNTIGNTVNTIQSFSKKTWDFLQIDRVLAVLTWVGVLHNAYMLSNGLTQTLFSMISNVLDVFGIEDSEGNALDIGEIVGGWTENLMKALLGEETVDGMKDTWKRFNRIYQAAANLLYSVQSMFYSMAEITEILSDYTGKIGNALKKSGTILQESFNWMTPKADFTEHGFFKWMNRTQEAVELIDTVFQEVKSIQDTAAEMFEQGQELRKAVEEGEKKKAEEETKAKNNSTRPNLNITPQDEHRAGE